MSTSCSVVVKGQAGHWRYEVRCGKKVVACGSRSTRALAETAGARELAVYGSVSSGRRSGGGGAAIGKAHLAAARRWLGDAPADVLDAKARCYAWRPFAAHTNEERAEHKADVATVETYEASIKPYDLPGADPMGDE